MTLAEKRYFAAQGLPRWLVHFGRCARVSCPRNNLQNDRRSCYFLKAAMIFKGACGPIFGIQSKPSPAPNVWVPIIPNIGPRCASGVDHPHIGFQKKT